MDALLRPGWELLIAGKRFFRIQLLVVLKRSRPIESSSAINATQLLANQERAPTPRTVFGSMALPHNNPFPAVDVKRSARTDPATWRPNLFQYSQAVQEAVPIRRVIFTANGTQMTA